MGHESIVGRAASDAGEDAGGVSFGCERGGGVGGEVSECVWKDGGGEYGAVDRAGGDQEEWDVG